LLERAAAEGFGITIHAGEAGPPAHVWEAITELYAQRIGHGIQSSRDRALMERLCEQNIVLEVCPTSNFHTGAVASPHLHPLAALVQAGVPVALSSDDPSISDIRLTDEYYFAVAEAGMNPAALSQMVLTAASHAFLPPTEKSALLARLRSDLSAITNLPL
nr:adenosine deaminase [Ardenticatenales bacterium]